MASEWQLSQFEKKLDGCIEWLTSINNNWSDLTDVEHLYVSQKAIRDQADVDSTKESIELTTEQLSSLQSKLTQFDSLTNTVCTKSYKVSSTSLNIHADDSNIGVKFSYLTNMMLTHANKGLNEAKGDSKTDSSIIRSYTDNINAWTDPTDFGDIPYQFQTQLSENNKDLIRTFMTEAREMRNGKLPYSLRTLIKDAKNEEAIFEMYMELLNIFDTSYDVVFLFFIVFQRLNTKYKYSVGYNNPWLYVMMHIMISYYSNGVDVFDTFNITSYLNTVKTTFQSMLKTFLSNAGISLSLVGNPALLISNIFSDEYSSQILRDVNLDDDLQDINGESRTEDERTIVTIDSISRALVKEELRTKSL